MASGVKMADRAGTWATGKGGKWRTGRAGRLERENGGPGGETYPDGPGRGLSRGGGEFIYLLSFKDDEVVLTD